MTNTYRLRLNGCGEQRTKEIDLELSAADARRLAEWDLGYLDRRSSPGSPGPTRPAGGRRRPGGSGADRAGAGGRPATAPSSMRGPAAEAARSGRMAAAG